MSDTETLPEGWVDATLGELTEKRVPKVTPEGDGTFTYVDISSVDSKTKRIVEPKKVISRDAPSRARQHIKVGDVLVSMTRPNLNAVARVPRELDGAVASTGFDVLRAKGVDPSWIFARVRSSQFVKEMTELVQGALYPAIKSSDVRSHHLPVPPLNEQRRIVAKIEALQGRSQSARSALEAIPLLLEKFSQSVLGAAFRGDLTADWRAHNPDVEPASTLLARIRTERRHRWEEAELAKMRAKGKEPKNDKWKSKYKEPATIDASSLPPLPESWCWCALEELAIHTSGFAFRSEDFVDEGIQVIKLGNLYQSRLDLSRDPSYLPSDHSDAAINAILPGDLLVSQTGTRHKRDYGHFVLVPRNAPRLLLNQRVLDVRPVRSELAQWILLASRLEPYRQHFYSHETGGVNQGNVGVAGVMRGPVPLAPIQEIAALTRKTSSLERNATTVSNTMSGTLAALARLDQSVLTSAFKGALVSRCSRRAEAVT